MLYPGYSSWKYDKQMLKNKVERVVEVLHEVRVGLDADCLILSGSSGVWMGGMLTMAQDLPVVLVRKDGENSHGSVVEGPAMRRGRGIIVDDFISTGATINRIIGSLEVWGAGLRAVGVLEHCRSENSGWTEAGRREFTAANGDVLSVFNMDLSGWRGM